MCIVEWSSRQPSPLCQASYWLCTPYQTDLGAIQYWTMHVVYLSAHYKTHVGTTPSPMGSNPDRAERGMYSASCWRADREEGVACDSVAARDQTNRQHHKMIPRIHYILCHLPPPTHTVLTGFGPLWSRLIAIFILLLNNEPVERVGSEEDNQ